MRSNGTPLAASLRIARAISVHSPSLAGCGEEHDVVAGSGWGGRCVGSEQVAAHARQRALFVRSPRGAPRGAPGNCSTARRASAGHPPARSRAVVARAPPARQSAHASPHPEPPRRGAESVPTATTPPPAPPRPQPATGPAASTSPAAANCRSKRRASTARSDAEAPNRSRRARIDTGMPQLLQRRSQRRRKARHGGDSCEVLERVRLAFLERGRAPATASTLSPTAGTQPRLARSAVASSTASCRKL